MSNIILILATVGLFQGVFLSIYLVVKKGKRETSNLLLAFLLMGLTVRIGKSVFNYYFALDAWQKNIGISGILIVGPSLWFYGRNLMEKQKLFPKRNYFHLFPFALIVLCIPFIPSNGEFTNYWNYGIVVVHLSIYLVLSWKLLLKKRSLISENTFSWYRNILFGVTLIWFYYLGNFLNYNLHYITGPIFYTFLIYAFTYVFLNRHDFRLDKYEKSKLDKSTSESLFKKVNQLFVEEQVYLDSSLSLNKVAEKLTISSRELSQVINEIGKQNFHEFINQYRIEKAKALLMDRQYSSEKIATIAYMSGFGTVTSFNVAFKKHTGTNPSNFKKSGTRT